MFTHQAATVLAPPGPGRPAIPWRVSADHWLAGGLQEFSGGGVRGFTVGMVGLTRYAAEGDSEFRFTVSTGGGVKLLPASRVGVRLDGRSLPRSWTAAETRSRARLAYASSACT